MVIRECQVALVSGVPSPSTSLGSLGIFLPCRWVSASFSFIDSCAGYWPTFSTLFHVRGRADLHRLQQWAPLPSSFYLDLANGRHQWENEGVGKKTEVEVLPPPNTLCIAKGGGCLTSSNPPSPTSVSLLQFALVLSSASLVSPEHA